jgi:uncharacterized alpha-E superfamily protein
MLSRIADSMYWLGRYLERSEGMLRMIHTQYVLSLDKSPSELNNMQSLMHVFAPFPTQHEGIGPDTPNQIIQYLLFEPKNENSLRLLLNKARENARGMQDHITKEVWEQVNQMYRIINNPNTEKQLQRNEGLSVIGSLLKNCLLYTGITDATMPRGMGWNFMGLGKFTERSLLTLELGDFFFKSIQYDLQQNKDVLFWRNLLFSLSGYEFHLKNYRSFDYNFNVFHQLMLHPQFAHSVIYCFNRIKTYLQQVTGENRTPMNLSLLNQFGRLSSHVAFADIDDIRQRHLKKFLDDTKSGIYPFTHSLSQTFFAYH